MTALQLDIEAWQLARTTDPDTSHAAAVRVLPKAGSVRARVLWLFTYQHQHMTDEQLIAAYRGQVERGVFRHSTESSIRTRRHELVDGGWLEDSGMTQMNVFGNEMTVWRLK